MSHPFEHPNTRNLNAQAYEPFVACVGSFVVLVCCSIWCTCRVAVNLKSERRRFQEIEDFFSLKDTQGRRVGRGSGLRLRLLPWGQKKEKNPGATPCLEATTLHPLAFDPGTTDPFQLNRADKK